MSVHSLPSGSASYAAIVALAADGQRIARLSARHRERYTMMGARSLRLSFQPTKENLLTILQGSAVWRNRTIITLVETSESPKVQQSTGEAESAVWERRWSGGQATCSGGNPDRATNDAATLELEDRLQGTSVQYATGSAEDAVFGRWMHPRKKRVLLSDLLFPLQRGGVATAEGTLRRPALGWGQASVQYGLAFRSAVTVLQKVGGSCRAGLAVRKSCSKADNNICIWMVQRFSTLRPLIIATDSWRSDLRSNKHTITSLCCSREVSPL